MILIQIHADLKQISRNLKIFRALVNDEKIKSKNELKQPTKREGERES